MHRQPKQWTHSMTFLTALLKRTRASLSLSLHCPISPDRISVPRRLPSPRLNFRKPVPSSGQQRASRTHARSQWTAVRSTECSAGPGNLFQKIDNSFFKIDKIDSKPLPPSTASALARGTQPATRPTCHARSCAWAGLSLSGDLP